MSLSTYFLEYGRHGQLRRGHRRRGRAYAPTSNTASHENHERIPSWVSFSFPYEYGLRLAAHRAAGAPPKTKMMSELKFVSAVVPLVPLNGKNHPTRIRYSAE